MHPNRAINPLLQQLLACPRCHAPLHHATTCPSCGQSHRLQNEVPVFLDEEAEEVPETHQSNPLGPEFEAILQQGDGLTLNIGAGATRVKYPHCVEFEHKIFCHTDVVGDAHHLPFREGVFDRVFAFNVFEHLRDPRAAAAEIFRVLKPGGQVAIHTAFLQALHEEPAHFYNATEFGVREWFAQFAIDRCGVSANFSPGYTLAFLMSNVLATVRSSQTSPEDLLALSRTTLGDWAAFWEGRAEPPPGFHALLALPQDAQGRVAAGFELLARKPSSR